MKRFISKYWSKDLIRPAIYKGFTRFILSLTAVLLWNEFTNVGKIPLMLTYAFVFFGIFWGVMGWIIYLRLDGVGIPKKLRLRMPGKKKPMRGYGDMSDYVDDQVVSFEELEEEEKDLCCLLADIACCVIFLILSFLPF